MGEHNHILRLVMNYFMYTLLVSGVWNVIILVHGLFIFY